MPNRSEDKFSEARVPAEGVSFPQAFISKCSALMPTPFEEF
jgi:hypothetical protein